MMTWRRLLLLPVVFAAGGALAAGYVLSEKVEGPGRATPIVNDPEYDTVIHPGPADGSRIWNANANWFMYAPAFAFGRVEGAMRYRFEVTDDLHRVHEFSSDRPTAPLAPVWSRLPTGYVTVVCTGFDAKGQPCGEAGRRTFWKAAGFREGTYPPAARSYRAAAIGVYSYVFGMKETQYLLEHGKPDPSYELNTYASKMLGALIRGMIRYAQLVPGTRERALAVAHAAADHLIARSQSEGAPLAHFPPTYDGRGEKDNDYLAEKLNDQVMLIYPAQVAGAFLDLAAATGETKYREQAVRIAATYLRLQGEDGTWPLCAYLADGRPVGRNRLIPIQNVVPLFERLYDLTKDGTYRRAADRAFATLAGRLGDWNWEGQFEDIAGSARYQNLTKHDACSTAIYFASRFPGDPLRRAQMRELLRFAEDQFVCWEPPYRHGRWNPEQKFWNNEYDKWFTPCALEQYACYAPIDSSAAKLIRTYLALYRSEGRAVDLAKARALGDTATRTQFPDGRIPTWWWPDRAGKKYADWINCMMATAEALLELDKEK